MLSPCLLSLQQQENNSKVPRKKYVYENFMGRKENLIILLCSIIDTDVLPLLAGQGKGLFEAR